MPDVQSSLISAVIGGGVVATINNIFARSNKDNEWRSQQLIEDKCRAREIINRINSKYLDSLRVENYTLDYCTELFPEIDLLSMYLDPNNINCTQLNYHYRKLYQHVREINNMYQDILDHHTEDELFFADYPEFIELNKARNEIVTELKSTIHKYFSYYYPKPSILARIKNCLCSK